ncbi:MAG: hypothetical protein IH886_01870 [Nitrospinae bacterium]|nr:hypothetical protein [Nitrospinota bacterium]
MGKYLDIARKLNQEKTVSIPQHAGLVDPDSLEPVKGAAVFTDLLTPVELGYYQDLIEIMQSAKFGMSQNAAEREAGQIIARNRQPLQIKQAAQDYKKYGYVKIYSAVLGRAVYLAKHELAAKRVPNRDIPVYLESDIQAAKGLKPEEVKILLEAKFILGGRITISKSKGSCGFLSEGKNQGNS